jgi:membrane protein YqaA with SNARE-associated domain
MPQIEILQDLVVLLLGLGLLGLFLIAFVDSAGIPTAGGPDMVLLLLVVHGQGPGELAQLLPAVVIGSTLGCLAMYYFGRRGGARLLERFAAERRVSIKEKIDRYGLWTILVAVLGPPPYPTKIFVLSAGVFKMGLGPFLSGVLLGRVLRYGAVGYLALRFGERAKELLVTHYPVVFLALAGLVGLVLLLRWRRTR